MHRKRIIANCLLSVIIISSIPRAFGLNTSNIKIESTEELLEVESTETIVDTEITETITDKEVDDTINNIGDINTQLNELYNKVGSKLNVDYKYVKILHILAGGQAVYADKKPNIYIDETVTTLNAPFYIDGSDTKYKEFSDIICADQSIERPSPYYLPDAAYSVAYDIVQLMNDRYNYDRGGLQIYFNTLKSDVKKEILFCEAVMLYTGESEEAVNNFYMAYEKMLYDKESYENVIDTNEDGTFKFKDQYMEILKDNNITDENTIKNLAIILSFDENLAANDNSETLKDEYVLPYRINYTSRENMMIAAMSLVGKVRYVWGGGHAGASSINGINPVWFQFEQLYDDTPTIEILDENTGDIKEVKSDSFGHCIKPSGSWCPIHGTTGGDCSFSNPTVSSLDEYINTMSKYIDVSELETDKYSELMKSIDYTGGVSVDRLNGLDCSGYVSWVYNQITDRYNIDYTASNFTDNVGIKEVEFGSELLPGDVFAWKAHIVAIVGRVSDSNKVYITTESTPNVIRFGVVYYSGAKQSEIDEAKEIARQANILIGNINEYEEPHVYCMNTAGLYVQYTDNEGNILTQSEANTLDTTEVSSTQYNYCKIGRLRDMFIDESIQITGYDKPIKDMYAKDIIQYTLSKMPYQYVSGYNNYDGDIFDKSVVATDLGVIN